MNSLLPLKSQKPVLIEFTKTAFYSAAKAAAVTGITK